MHRKYLFALCALLSWSALELQAFAQRRVPNNTSQRRIANATPAENTTRTQVMLADEARHQLVTLPYYGVFDWLEGRVLPDNTIVLRGQVVRPTTKSDAAARVRDIEGVKGVDNQIEVLPLSPNDDDIRLRVYRAIYNFNSPLFRYATRAVPPIHIIVDRGHVTLKGVVANEGDRRLAYIRASGVPGAFSVANDLSVEGKEVR